MPDAGYAGFGVAVHGAAGGAAGGAGRGWRGLCVRGAPENAYETVNVSGGGGRGGSDPSSAAAAAYWWLRVASVRHRHRRASQTQTLEFHEHNHRPQDHYVNGEGVAGPSNAGVAGEGGAGGAGGTMPRARRLVRGVCSVRGVRVALSASTSALAPPEPPRMLLLQRWRPPYHALAHTHYHAPSVAFPRPSCSYHLLPESQRGQGPQQGGERSCCEADTQPSDSASTSESDGEVAVGAPRTADPAQESVDVDPPPRLAGRRGRHLRMMYDQEIDDIERVLLQEELEREELEHDQLGHDHLGHNHDSTE